MGLDIDLKSFEKIKAKERDILIYKNVLYIRDKLDDYKVHRKIQYWWLSGLTGLIMTVLGLKKLVSI